ncbi:hypothetical protein AB1Y20_017375 [Prymnesium parvum]|uniref:Hexosyltransferase n=1 Tax=Prymnesium parvum TaxID=97485 RepID=A0AB34JN00_PRYPA
MEGSATWATLLASDDYLRGVQCLARGLRQVDSSFPLAVLVTEGVSASVRAAVAKEPGCIVRQAPAVQIPAADAAQYLNPRFECCWTKITLWSWTEFSRVGYLDADMCVVANMDALLTESLEKLAPACNSGVPSLLAVQECACFLEDPVARKACPWKQVEGNAYPNNLPPAKYFNGGLLVLVPSVKEHAAMLTALSGSPSSRVYRFAEQDFLNEHFSGRWATLSYEFNAMKCFFRHHRPALWDWKQVRNIHFTHAKPWRLKARGHAGYGALNRRWWRTYLTGEKLSAATLERMVMIMFLKAKGSGRNESSRTASSTGPQCEETEEAEESESEEESEEESEDSSSTTRAQESENTKCTVGPSTGDEHSSSLACAAPTEEATPAMGAVASASEEQDSAPDMCQAPSVAGQQTHVQ